MSQVVVNMKFQADTTQAKAKMQELQNSLKAIGSVSNQNLPMNQLSSGLEHAKTVAAQLQVQLQNAFNQNTGKLDLSRFIQQMNQSGMSLEKYKAALMQAGPIGQQAFGQLATAIASADTHVIRISERFAKLGQTLANTMRWQISSKALMAVTSTISNAYRFAQDLNKSLNNIRIVTGKSAEEMEKFAEKANDAAKALNTTTTKYTDAALIFFQQGLSEKKAIERTNTTIKLANVTGQSVEEISNQLTAIWNNFDDGTKPLEYYADVITALGAATASSSKEISEGLEKFAAVGETVGLSYEYATAALATVTATTRQSADVVGTAFKTLFARIQDLELGNTLDDGTTLGQYSQALEAVGINIKNANGEVKDMNIILDEMGAKWGTLSKDAQIALAQNVAGVRQYTQLIALMDNYDFFKENLKTAEESSGTLQEQADIYAESWKAARDEVTAALEDIYKTLLDDDAFISILHFFADFLKNLNDVIDSVGGLRGVILLLTTALMNMTKVSMANWMSNVGASMMAMTATGREKIAATRDQALALSTSGANGGLSGEHLRNKVLLEREYYDISKNLSAQEKATLQILKDNLATEQSKTEEKLNQLSAAEKLANKEKFAAAKITGVKTEDLSGLTNQARQIQMTSNLRDQVSLGSDVNYTNLQGYFSRDFSETSINQASTAVQNILKQMEAFKFGVQGAETELEETFGPAGYQELKKYYQQIQLLAEEIKKVKNTPLEQRDSSRKEELARQEKIQEYEKTARRTKGGDIDKRQSGYADYKKLKQESDAYNQSLSEQAKVNAKAKQSSNELSESVTAQDAALKQNITDFKEKNQVTKEGGAAVDKAILGAKQLGDAHYEASSGVNNDAEALRRFREEAEKAAVLPITFSQRLTSMASMAMSAAMAFQSLQSAINIFQNEDSTFGQKMLQLLMSFGMVVPMLTSSFSRLNIAKMFGLSIDKKGLAFLPTKLGADGKEIAMTGLQKLAHDALNTSLLTTIALYAAVALAGALVVAGIVALIQGREKEKTAAEKAAEAHAADAAALERMNEVLDETKTKLQEVKDLLNSYDEISNTFDKLVEGTEAWNENLQKQQEIISDLIEKYPELATSGMFAFKNGIYTIAEGKEELLKQYMQGQATTGVLLAQMGQTNAAAKERASKEESNYLKALENQDFSKIRLYDLEKKYGGSTYAASSGIRQVLSSQDIQEAGNLLVQTMRQGGSLEDTRILLETEYGEAFVNDLYALHSKNIEEYEKILENHEQNLESINKQNEASWLIVAQSITSSLQGFSEMSDIQQQASTTLVAKQLENIYKDMALDDFRVGYGLEKDEGAYGGGEGERYKQFVEDLQLAVGTDKGGWKSNEDTAWNMEHSALGKEALATYTKEVLNKDIETMGKKEFHAERLDIGEETIYFSDVLQYYADQLANSRLDLQKAFEDVKNMPDEIAAAISINYSTLTEDQMKGIATQNADGTWELTQGHLDNVTKELEAQGFSAEKISGYLTEMKENAKQYDAAMSETIRKQADLQKGNALIAQESEKFDLDAETLERYAKSLQKTGKMSYEAAAKMAIANAKMSKGVEGLRDKLEDVIDTLKNYDTTSYEFAEAAAEISESLSLMFGADVSNELIKKWADDGSLQKLAAGGQEAVETFENLRLEVGKDFIMSLSIDDEYKTQFISLLDELNAIADNASVGTTFDLDGQEAIKTMNEMLESGQLTVDQVQQMFDSIGWSPEITWVDGKPNVTKEWQGVATDVPYGQAPEEGAIKWSYIETRTTTQIPQIGDVDNNGKAQATYTGVSGQSSLKKSAGGSGKSKKQTKKVSDEAERYHEITQKLEDLNREYDKLGKLKDRAFGQSHLDYLDEEAKKLDEVIAGQKQYISEIEAALEIDKSKLSEYGASFDSSGRIINYDEMVAANVDSYNAAVNKFNAGGMSDEQFEKYEEAYERFTSDIEQYEETLNLLENEEETLFDKQNERFDKSLEKAEYVVEYGTSLVEDSLSIIEYQLEKIEDKAYSTAEALALVGQKMNEVSKKSNIYKDGIETTLAASGLSIDDILGASPEELAELVANGTFTAEQVEQLRNYRDELLNTNQEMKDMANETLDKLLEGFDEWNEAIDKNKEKIDHLKEVTSSYRDIIDLIGKDNLGVSNQMLEQMNEFNIAASQSQVDITRRQLEENKRSLEEAREEYRNAASEEEKYYWGQVVESLEETVMQGESDLLSATQDSLNTIQEAFKDTLTNITEEFEKAISGMYGSLEALQTAYDQRTDKRERYLEDYAKIYELSKLTRDINKSMDESDSIRGKQRLLEIQEEINALQESGVEMTQFEVDELRARYELRLAEIALEEAQNAKSQVRMTRDSEGNWSYTYTADQDAIDNAQQNYEDKLYAYQNLTTEYIYDLESQIMEIPSQLSEALQAIWEDTTLTDEEKEARAQEAIDFYTQKDAFLKEQMEKAIGRSKELYDTDWKNYSNATGYKISANEEWIKSFDGTVLSQITGFKTLEEYQQAFAGSAMTMANDMRTAYQTMTSNIDKTLQNMGTSMATFAQDLQGLMNTNKQKIEEYTKEVDDDIEKMGTSSAEAMKKAADNWALYANYVANSAGANENLATALNNVIAAIGNVTAPLDALKEKYQEVERQAKSAAVAIANVSGSNSYYKEEFVVEPPDDSPSEVIVDNESSGAIWYSLHYDAHMKRNALSGDQEPVISDYRGLKYIKVSGMNDVYEVFQNNRRLGYVKSAGVELLRKQSMLDTKMNSIGLPSGFDTGGYTGSWDSSGRLAMLHQKELVLNADDTKNFLAAVNIVRELSAAIDLKALAYQNALGQMSGAIRMSHEPQRLQQDVTIHAEFPNVTERNEIEAAFRSLVNDATQYIYRK